ncbi:MAG TPA: response regulator transcription factor [Spirochaetia bacterium]|nr:response regulator transcription factor [Spirochaetia bacterium]
MTSRTIKIVLVDDQVLFVESLRRVLENLDPTLVVTGVAHDAREAIEFVSSTGPDIVLMDVRMPGMDGVEAVRYIHERFPDIRIIMLTTFDDDEYVLSALEHGAVGYLLKDIEPEKLIDSIRAVHSGSVLMSEAVASKLTRLTHGDGRGSTRPKPEWFQRLSARERELLRHMVGGLSNREIASAMFIAEQTVRNHISEIYAKIGENDRARIIREYRSLFPEDR